MSNVASGALKVIGVVAVVSFGLLQFVRPPRHNAKVDPSQSLLASGQMPEQVKSIVERACRDCHTEETHWRWYSNVAPFLWLQVADVNAGREHMNLSRWNRYTPEQQADRLHGMCEMVMEGEMPLWYYRPLHPGARLSDDDVQAICAWSSQEQQRLGVSGSEAGQGHHH